MAKRAATTKKRARASARARARMFRNRALKGWKTRRERKLRRSVAKKKPIRKTTKVTRARTPERVDYLVSFSFSFGKREYRRDLVVPAPRGSSPAQIVAQAKREIPKGAIDLRPFLNLKNATIYEGPRTTRKKTELR